MNIRPLIASIIIVLSIISSCKRETETYELKGKEYAAERVGKVRLYKVDSILFARNSNFGKDTTLKYFERHATKSILKDSAGKDYFYHQVHKSPNLIDWEPYYTYRTYVDSINYIKVINNIKRIHLWYPINEFKTWDGNQYNEERGGQKFRYIDSDEFMLPDSIYPNQISVRLKKEILPLTESYVHLETYSANIGMVYKVEYFNNRQRSDTSGVLSEQGYYLYHNLIEHN